MKEYSEIIALLRDSAKQAIFRAEVAKTSPLTLMVNGVAVEAFAAAHLTPAVGDEVLACRDENEFIAFAKVVRP